MLDLRGGKIIGKGDEDGKADREGVHMCVQMYIYTNWGGGGEASIINNFTLLP